MQYGLTWKRLAAATTCASAETTWRMHGTCRYLVKRKRNISKFGCSTTGFCRFDRPAREGNGFEKFSYRQLGDVNWQTTPGSHNRRPLGPSTRPNLGPSAKNLVYIYSKVTIWSIAVVMHTCGVMDITSPQKNSKISHIATSVSRKSRR